MITTIDTGNEPTKRGLTIYAPAAKFGFRDLSAVNFFQVLEAQYDVHWVFAGAKPKDLPQTLKKVSVVALPGQRYRFWLYSHVLIRHDFEKRLLKVDLGYPKIGLSKSIQATIRFIIKTGLSKPIRNLLQKLYFWTGPNRDTLFKGTDAILAIGSPKDATIDDLLIAARNRGVKSALLITNWDGASSKPLGVKPDMFFTWGERPAKLAKSIHKVEAYSVGSARYDHYRGLTKPTQTEAKAILGLKPDTRYVLFAGASLPFIEPQVLEKLASKARAANIAILYRPHPASWSGHSLDALHENVRDVIKVDPTLQPSFAQTNVLESYPILYSAVEGLISPFSTMVLEACYFGLPVLGIAFDDPSHTDFDWVSNAKNQPHLQALHEDEEILACFDIEKLDEAFNAFVEQMQESNQQTQEKRRQLFQDVVLLNEKPFMMNLQEVIETHLLVETPEAKR